ncbi:MAG TPA: MBL fold metallo-hydrolase [Chthoniobacterales bacterium]|nr:MBL fold metallo-hydrolase [Chthoniobacterales bacterium]
MLSVTFLGTGTSMGVPVILCECRVCHSPDPRDHRWRSSVYLQTPTASWVIDTGAEFRLQALRAGIEKIDAVIYTHAHADHVVGFDDLRRYSSANGDRMPIYASAPTLEHLDRMFHYAFSGEAKFPGYVHPQAHLINGPFWLGENEIVPIRVEHGNIHTFGFLVRVDDRSAFAYISDCKILPEEGVNQLRGVDTLVLGTPLWRSHFSHLSLEEGIALSARIQPRRTIFTHLSHDFLHAETEKRLPPGCSLAYDGLELLI